MGELISLPPGGTILRYDLQFLKEPSGAEPQASAV